MGDPRLFHFRFRDLPCETFTFFQKCGRGPTFSKGCQPGGAACKTLRDAAFKKWDPFHTFEKSEGFAREVPKTKMKDCGTSHAKPSPFFKNAEGVPLFESGVP